MPEVFVCTYCKKNVTEDQEYVVTNRNQYGVEVRVHAECEKNRPGGPVFAGA